MRMDTLLHKDFQNTPDIYHEEFNSTHYSKSGPTPQVGSLAAHMCRPVGSKLCDVTFECMLVKVRVPGIETNSLLDYFIRRNKLTVFDCTNSSLSPVTF